MQLCSLLSSVTPGSIYPVAVGGDVAQVGIDNDSPYDVWVSFGPQQPLAAPGPTTQALYNGVARSMATSYLPVPDLTPPFNGVIYLGIYNPAQLVLPGTVSARANVYVTSLATNEAPGAVFAVPRIADVSSQPRMIAVPISPTLYFSSNLIASNGNVQTQNIFQTQPVGTAGKLTYYVFALAFSIYVSGSTSVGSAAYDIKVQDSNSGGNVGPAQSMFHSIISSQQAFGMAFPHPISAVRPGVGNVGATQSTLQLVVQPLVIPAGATLFLHFAVCFDMDSANNEAVPSFGGGFGVSPIESNSTNVF